LFGAQSAINMAVNLALIPAKGMTLPFISYGGSSMISLAYGMGMLLAFTRERPRTAMLQPLPYPGTTGPGTAGVPPALYPHPAGVPPALDPANGTDVGVAGSAGETPSLRAQGRVAEERAGRPWSADRVGAAGSTR
jgi:hypothetical protein